MHAFPAHIRIMEDGAKKIQSCTEHSRNTAYGAEQMLQAARLGRTAYLAGLLHDCGKFKRAFAAYLTDAVCNDHAPRHAVIHSFAGVRLLFDRFHRVTEEDPYAGIVCEILAYAIGAHHGLFDCIDEKHVNGFLHRIGDFPVDDTEAIGNYLRLCADDTEIKQCFMEASEELIPVIEACSALTEADDTSGEALFLIGLLTRLITSAVIEGDRRDTAEFMRDVNFPAPPERQLWQTLLARLESKLDRFPCISPIDRARRQISEVCRTAADTLSGIIRLNVPTGGGKTLSALRFSLAHAAVCSKTRVIFVSPLLSILDQNSSVIRDMLEADELILEHHSNVIRDAHTVDELTNFELLQENWSAPIIITTMVQLLNTLFDGRTASVRRFHALVDAVIVIDEVQTIPAKMLTLFHLAIAFLSEFCGATIVLCSATQPCDQAAEHPIRAAVSEMMPYDAALWRIFKRTELTHGGTYRMEEIPDFVRARLDHVNSVLVVCNKKDEAEMLFSALSDTDADVFHLSASMCMAHRKAVLAEIYRSLADPSRKTICVSTQVIEAGVDISFGMVIRLTAGLDSIVQSAGRCNRSGESESPLPVYILRVVNENLTRLPEIHAAKQAMEEVLAGYERSPEHFGHDLASEQSVREYYRQLYKLQNSGYQDFPAKDRPTLYSLLSDNAHWISENDKTIENFALRQAFSSAGSAFRVFEDDSEDVIVPYGNGADVICDLLSERAKHDIAFVKECLERAKGYTVSVYAWQKRALGEALIPLVGGTMLGLAAEFYDKHTGLQIQERGEKSCDTQIW